MGEEYSSSDEEERSTSADEEPAASAPVSSSNGVPAQKILSFWNEEIQSVESPMPRVQRIKQGTQRYKHVRARWKENPDLELWKTVIAKAARSSFLNGRVKAWQADFDWIIKSPDNFTKVLEGKYDDREEPTYASAGTAPF